LVNAAQSSIQSLGLNPSRPKSSIDLEFFASGSFGYRSIKSHRLTIRLVRPCWNRSIDRARATAWAADGSW